METALAPPASNHRVEHVLRQLRETLRPHCGFMPEPELDRLATELLETSVAFLLDWVEA